MAFKPKAKTLSSLFLNKLGAPIPVTRETEIPHYQKVSH